MRVQRLSLRNFRRFECFDTDFHEQLTVLVARNGEGKTSVLDGVAIALGTFVGAFDLGKARHIQKSDARYIRTELAAESEQQYPVEVIADFDIPENGVHTIKRELSGPKNKTTTKDAAPLTAYGKTLMTQVRELQQIPLPFIGYYGSGRLWVSHRNIQRKIVLKESRTMGYEDCLTSSSNFKQLQQWMRLATLAVLQQQQISEYQGHGLADQVEGIKEAVDKVLEKEGWHNFHYSLTHEELVMSHPDIGMLPVSMLSDGVRAMVSLAADIAWRCTKLNPHFGSDAPSRTLGIALLDEVDLHLHPAWQQQVISSLISAFPKIQFIVTTHSPQVLSTVDKANIRLIKNHWNDEKRSWVCTSETPAFQTKGVASYEALARIMGIDPVPDVEEAKWLSDYREFIELEKYEQSDALKLREKLEAHFGPTHPELLECDRLIRLMDMKREIKGKGNKDA